MKLSLYDLSSLWVLGNLFEYINRSLSSTNQNAENVREHLRPVPEISLHFIIILPKRLPLVNLTNVFVFYFFEIVPMVEQGAVGNTVPVFSVIVPHIWLQNKLFLFIPLSESYFLITEEGLFQKRKMTGSQIDEEPISRRKGLYNVKVMICFNKNATIKSFQLCYEYSLVIFP